MTGADFKPSIISYEHRICAREGERVLLQVQYAGTPQPTLTWTFQNTVVREDYATEIGADGMLTLLCVEPKHAGL